MARDHHHQQQQQQLRRVGAEAFGLIDQLYGQSISSSNKSPPGSQELYRQQRPYVYGGPQAVTVVLEPNSYIGPEVHMENKTTACSYQLPEAFMVTKAAPKSNARCSIHKVVQVPAAAEEQPALTCQDAARMLGGIRICEHLNFRAKPHKTWDF